MDLGIDGISDEIKKYDIDHTLFNENIDEVAGWQEFWDDKKARTVAENINISCGGDNGLYPNIAISDKGEGQTPEKLPQTIMSLHVGNKKSIKKISSGNDWWKCW